MALMDNAVADPYIDKRAPAVAFEPVTDPAGWTAEEMTVSEDWLYRFDAAEIAEIRDAIAPYDRDGVDLMQVAAADLPLPRLGKVLAEIRQELLYGRGFILFRGLPVEEMGKRATAVAFWAVTQHLGDGVFSQNKRGHVLGHVTDLGESRSNTSQRGPYSREEIIFS